MQKIKDHKAFKVVILILALAILTPTAIKFGHIFSKHKHEICHDESQDHLHKNYPDCNFHKFKLSSLFTIPVIATECFSVRYDKVKPVSEYLFFDNNLELLNNLRSPPFLV